MAVTRLQCQRYVGGWVQFRTPWGVHRGIVESVTPQAMLVRMPRQYAPAGLASYTAAPEGLQRPLADVSLAQWRRPYGGWGNPGFGWWWGGWFWWWLAFAWIFALAFLWW